jgi:hypothetical protein
VSRTELPLPPLGNGHARRRTGRTATTLPTNLRDKSFWPAWSAGRKCAGTQLQEGPDARDKSKIPAFQRRTFKGAYQ